MPDKRKHRGRHPDDDRLFSPGSLPILRAAVEELAWLLSRCYAEVSALKLVGDRHDLTRRQRMAVRRCTCSDTSRARRDAKRRAATDLSGGHLLIDGYNVLITVESALSGGLVFVGRDGCYRDLAGVHGTYRKVEETIPAVDLIVEGVNGLNVSSATLLLDRPVNNSGRLRALIDQRVAAGAGDASHTPAWTVELADSPDACLAASNAVVATSDSVVLDRCRCWLNLAAHLVDDAVSNARLVDLRAPATA